MLRIESGQQYENRGDIYTVEYANDLIVLLQGPTKDHRLEKRDYFERCVDEGWFEPQQPVVDEERQEDSECVEVPFEDISWVGEKGAQALRSAGYNTTEDIQRASDSTLLSCTAVGETAVENIREWVEENTE